MSSSRRSRRAISQKSQALSALSRTSNPHVRLRRSSFLAYFFSGRRLIASLKGVVGDLDKVKRVVKVNGYIACPDSFTALPSVLNGCSNLLGEVFGDRGVHARSAVGVTSLPLGVPIEIDLVVEVED